MAFRSLDSFIIVSKFTENFFLRRCFAFLRFCVFAFFVQRDLNWENAKNAKNVFAQRQKARKKVYGD